MTRVGRFALRRVVAALFVLVAMITVTFVVFWLIPSEPALFVYHPPNGHLTAYQVTHGDHLLGIDKPKIDQYFHYLGNILRGRFGWSWSSVVLDGNHLDHLGPLVLWPELWVTLSLILGGAALVTLLSVPLGAFAGSRIGSLSDRTISLVALIGVCTHPMVLGLLIQSLFGRHLSWFPQVGYCPLIVHHAHPNAGSGAFSPIPGSLAYTGSGVGPSASGGCGGLVDWASHLALPWITFALLFLALYTRMVRASVADTLHEDYVRTARAKGASELRVIGRHVLPTATSRILTMVGMEIGTAIGVCIYIESVYRLNGLAEDALDQFGGNRGLDLPSMLAVVTLITLIVLAGNFLVDVLYAVVDPRTGRGPIGRRQKSLAGGVI